MPQLLGQLQHFLDDVTEYLSIVLQHVAPLAPLVFLVLLYCTVMLLVVGNIYFLFSCYNGVASLVTLTFWYIFTLSLLMMELSGLDWEVSALCPYITCLDPTLEVGPSDITTFEF